MINHSGAHGVSILLLLMLIFTACMGEHQEQSPPEAKKGVLDLRGLDVAALGTIPLNGEWGLYWKRFQAADAPEPASEFQNIPGGWLERISLLEKIGPGHGTYTLTILTDKPLGDMSLLLPASAGTALKIFVDGKPVLVSGRPGRSADESQPGLRFSRARFKALGNSTQVMMLVSNYHLYPGGLRYSIYMGESDALVELRASILSLTLFLASALIIISLFHMVTFLLRREEPAPFYFSLLTMLVTLLFVSSGERLLSYTLPELPWEFWFKLEFFSANAALIVLMLFVRSVYPLEIYRPALRGIIFVALVFGSSVLWAPGWLYARGVLANVILMPVLGTFVVTVVVKSLLRKRDGAFFFLVGWICIFGAGIHTGFSESGLVQSQFNYLPLGVIAFSLAQAGMLSQRFSKSFHKVQKLTGQLKARNFELLRLDQLKDDFLANTSHELRTPLNGIMGIADSLLLGAAGPINAELTENLKLIAASGGRLSSLVNDVLDFSRLSHGGIAIHPRPLDASSVIGVVLLLSRTLVGDKKLELLDEVKGDLPAVFADEDRLQQIFYNLVGNAVKFTESGSVRVSARERSGFVEFSVKDTGIGIPADKHKTIFDSFTQADSSISRQYTGTGLGLSITRHLIELHGGDIWVESEPGAGADFIFTLPISREPVEAQGRERSRHTPLLFDSEKEPKRIEFSEQIQGARVLIVDDDPVNLQVLHNHLALNDIQVIQAQNGRDALEYFDDGRSFDLILLDVMMPGLSGYEVCRIIRENYSTTELPVIMLTAKNRVSDMVIGLESGANDYILKPFDSRELMARVRTMLELKSASRSQSDLAALMFELETARTIQQSLLPAQPPQLAGLDLAVRYRSMENVGGDFYDFRPDGSRLGVLISDVSGHGIPAALIVSIVKIAFWFQKQSLPTPDRLFESMNEILTGNIGDNFVTACYVFLDLEKGVLLTSNAGHPPLLVWKKQLGELLRLRPMGRILGILPDAEYSTGDIKLASGDRVLMYTDGIFEVPNAQLEQFGMERLEAFLENNSRLSADEFADALMEAVTGWAGSPEKVDDDIALIVMDIE